MALCPHSTGTGCANPLPWQYIRGVPNFREQQNFRQPWLIVLLAVATLGSMFAVVVAAGISGPRVLLALWPLPIWAWLWSVTLETEVRAQDLRIKFKCFWPERLVRYNQIQSVKSIRYRPIRDYGGWGVRGWFSVRAFNVSGDRGVLITFVGGKTLMIGSQRADQLALAITERLP